MKKIFLIGLSAIMGLSLSGFANAQSAEDKEAKVRMEKAAKVKWKLGKNLKAALRQSEETGLPVVILFTGGSWCGYCVKLEKEILSKKEFKKGMDGVAIGVIVNFPSSSDIGKDKDAKKYGVQGVPTMVVVDSEGKKLGNVGYMPGQKPEKYVEFFKKYAPAKAE